MQKLLDQDICLLVDSAERDPMRGKAELLEDIKISIKQLNNNEGVSQADARAEVLGRIAGK